MAAPEEISNGADGAVESLMVQSIMKAGAKEVPTNFRQVVIENHPCPEGVILRRPDLQLPIIDLSNWSSSGDSAARAKLIEQMGNACKEWGFFQVVNHGIPQSVLQDGMEAAKEFFELPFERKQKYSMKPGTYVGYGRVFEYKDEGRYWNDILAHHVSPSASNEMDTVWPDQPPTYRERTDLYRQHILQLGSTLEEIISLSLGLKPSYVTEAFNPTHEHTAMVRTNLYPICPQPHLALGTASHSDSTILTILQQGDVPGLEVSHNGEWIIVEPIPGALIINIGDSLEVLTNGKYPSVDHRVLVNSGKERLSVGIFILPAWNCVVAPAPELIASSKALYSSIKFSDYFLTFFSKGLNGKSLVQALKLQT